MTLKPIDDHRSFKNVFKQKFDNILSLSSGLKDFFDDAFIDGTGYVVGGFLRDIANEREPRDLDIILTITSDKINELLCSSTLDFKINRMGGAKIFLENFEIDLWSIENNWSFKKRLVKVNEKYIVDNIASGCFYNFDSIVINIHDSMALSAKYYNNAVKKKELDIIYKGIEYQKANPTVEANILRAFYIKNSFDFTYSETCLNYLVQRLWSIYDKDESIISSILKVKQQYPKYDEVLTDNLVKENINELMEKNKTPLFDN